MKLLLIAPYFFEKHRWMISAYKAAMNLSKDIEVVVITTGRPRYEEINKNLRVYRCWDWFIPDPANYSIVPGLFLKIIKVITKEKPDVYMVNKHMFFTSFSVLLLRLLGKKVITATDTFPGINWQPKNHLVGIIMKIYSRLIGTPILKLSNKVILYHEDLVPVAQKLHLNYQIIHNGVDINSIRSASLPRDVKRCKDINICYIGRLESVKGYYDLLDITRSLTSNYDNVKFFFIGNYSGKEQLVKEWQSEKVIFLGHRDDTYSLLKVMDIFVLPSYSEGLPNALMEAMAAGLACISSKVGGAKVLIKHGVNGFLFEPGNTNGLRNKLSLLIKNKQLRNEFGMKAQQMIYEEFNWDNIRKQYLNLFNEIRK